MIQLSAISKKNIKSTEDKVNLLTGVINEKKPSDINNNINPNETMDTQKSETVEQAEKQVANDSTKIVAKLTTDAEQKTDLVESSQVNVPTIMNEKKLVEYCMKELPLVLKRRKEVLKGNKEESIKWVKLKKETEARKFLPLSVSQEEKDEYVKTSKHQENEIDVFNNLVESMQKSTKKSNFYKNEESSLKNKPVIIGYTLKP